MNDLSMKGAATMELLILEVLIVGLIAGLAGIIWLIVRNYFNDGHDFEDNRLEGIPLTEPHDGELSQEHSSRQSKASA